MNAALDLIQLVQSQGRLEHAFDQFERALEERLRSHFGVSTPERDRRVPEWPEPDDRTPYGRFVREHHLDAKSQLLVMLALAPSIKPDYFDRALQNVPPNPGENPQFAALV